MALVFKKMQRRLGKRAYGINIITECQSKESLVFLRNKNDSFSPVIITIHLL